MEMENILNLFAQQDNYASLILFYKTSKSIQIVVNSLYFPFSFNDKFTKYIVESVKRFDVPNMIEIMKINPINIKIRKFITKKLLETAKNSGYSNFSLQIEFANLYELINLLIQFDDEDRNKQFNCYNTILHSITKIGHRIRLTQDFIKNHLSQDNFQFLVMLQGNKTVDEIVNFAIYNNQQGEYYHYIIKNLLDSFYPWIDVDKSILALASVDFRTGIEHSLGFAEKRYDSYDY